MEFNDCVTKSDFIKYCVLFDESIKEIDSAYSTNWKVYSIENRHMVTVYYKDGSSEIRNLMAVVMETRLSFDKPKR